MQKNATPVNQRAERELFLLPNSWNAPTNSSALKFKKKPQKGGVVILFALIFNSNLFEEPLVRNGQTSAASHQACEGKGKRHIKMKSIWALRIIGFYCHHFCCWQRATRSYPRAAVLNPVTRCRGPRSDPRLTGVEAEQPKV